MSNWREPITDRTLQDVKNADSGSLDYQKGTLNADDLNRIEDNYKYLMAKLRSDAIFIPHRLRNYTETVLEYAEKENSILPEGYTQVEYIQTSGAQAIDTGFKPNQNTTVEMVYQCSNTNENTLVGCDTGWTNNGFFISMNAAAFGNNVKTGIAMYGSTKTTMRFEKGKIYKNGTLIATIPTTTFQTAYNLTLFALNRSGTKQEFFTGVCCSCKIWDNGTLIRYYITCKNVSGVIGLYDLVEGEFYTNAGTGTFTAGATVESEQVHELVETTTTYTDWQEHNLPWLSEINRIRANYNALVRLFLVGLGLPVLVESNYLDYAEVNDWERIALVGKMMFENMEREYRYCGMEENGGDRLL